MNKNKKITTTLLIGLLALSTVGCGNKSTETPTTNTDLSSVNTEIDSNKTETTDINTEKETTSNKDYSVYQIRSEFKIVGDANIQILAAVLNDAAIAGVSKQTDIKVDSKYLFMDKEIEAAKTSLENIEIESIKKLANIYIGLFEKQNEVIKQYTNKEITDEEFSTRISEIEKETVQVLVKELKLALELGELAEETGLEIEELLGTDTMDEEALKIYELKYATNLENFLLEAIQ